MKLLNGDCLQLNGKNKPTDQQREFMADMQQAGYMAQTAYSAQEATELLEKYLKMPVTRGNV